MAIGGVGRSAYQGVPEAPSAFLRGVHLLWSFVTGRRGRTVRRGKGGGD